jgi:hypothetical protein
MALEDFLARHEEDVSGATAASARSRSRRMSLGGGRQASALSPEGLPIVDNDVALAPVDKHRLYFSSSAEFGSALVLNLHQRGQGTRADAAAARVREEHVPPQVAALHAAVQRGHSRGGIRRLRDGGSHHASWAGGLGTGANTGASVDDAARPGTGEAGRRGRSLISRSGTQALQQADHIRVSLPVFPAPLLTRSP